MIIIIIHFHTFDNEEISVKSTIIVAFLVFWGKLVLKLHNIDLTTSKMTVFIRKRVSRSPLRTLYDMKHMMSFDIDESFWWVSDILYFFILVKNAIFNEVINNSKFNRDENIQLTIIPAVSLFS